jgi:hypothetical protein
MNLALNGFTWRTVLRAIPEPSRLEIQGTLTECYGPKAPLGEAFRTFTSGSRMHNRANASSPIDLWSEAARNAVASLLIFGGMASVGRWILPPRFSAAYQAPPWQAVFSVASIVIGFCLQRGRYVRIIDYLTLGIACATLFLLQPNSPVSPTSLSQTWRLVIAAMLGVVGSALMSNRISPKQRLALCLSFVVVATVVYGLNQPARIGFSFSHYMTFTISQVSLCSSAVFGWLADARAKQSVKVWWPSIIAVALGFFAALSNSDRFSGPLFKALGYFVVAFLIAAALSAVLLVLVRPQVFLTIVSLYVVNAIQMVPFASFDTSEWTLGTAAPFALVAAALGIATAGSRRALRS